MILVLPPDDNGQLSSNAPGDSKGDQKPPSVGAFLGVSYIVWSSMRWWQSVDVKSPHSHLRSLGTRMGGVSATIRLSRLNSPCLEVVVDNRGWNFHILYSPVDKAAFGRVTTQTAPWDEWERVHINHYLSCLRISLGTGLDIVHGGLSVGVYCDQVQVPRDDRAGRISQLERVLTLDDILIIAPYNAQIFKIKECLPGARVGTADKFQGQEAPIVVYSMTTSSPEERPTEWDCCTV